MSTDKLLTVTEACKLLQISPSTLRRADENGTIRVIRTPGGRRRVPMSEVLRYLGQDTEAE
jgi:putative resolvase